MAHFERTAIAAPLAPFPDDNHVRPIPPAAAAPAAPQVLWDGKHIASIDDIVPDHPLDEIAAILRSLTYGDMMELVTEMWQHRKDADITATTLPAVMHRWAASRARNQGRKP